MNQKERDIQRKLRILRHAEVIGRMSKACMYFGIGRATFYRWKELYKKDGEAGMVNNMACCRYRGHRDKVFNGTGGFTWKEGSSAASLSSRR
jgi:transposase-like protein